MRCFQSLAKVLFAALFLSPAIIAGAQTPVALPYTMTTVAGGLAPRTSYTSGSTVCPGTASTTTSSVSGDNCAAVSALFGTAGRGGAVVDQYGNVFVADDVTKAVHMIDATTGTMTLVAGLGTVCGSSAGKLDSAGDGCLASTQTTIGAARGIGLDAYGNVLIADYGSGFIHLVCRYASPLCTTGTPTPTTSNPIQVQVGYMGLVGGCASATGSGGSGAVGVDGTPGFSTLNSTNTNTASYPLNLSGSASAFKNTGACSTSLGDVESPRAAWGDIYGNVYYADTSSSRTRVILGPYTSSYFSGVNPLYAALEVNTNWTWTGTISTSSLKPGYGYTIANISGSTPSTTTATVTAGSACLTSITAPSGDGSVVYKNTSISSNALDSHADGCPFFDSAITASSGYTDSSTADAAGNLVFTDPNSASGLLRVFFVQGWANTGAATSAGASGSVASAGVAMYNAIVKNNPGVTPTPGYIYALAGGIAAGQTGFTSASLTTAPSLGNATTIPSANITKVAISPQGNIYIGNNTSVLFYDLYNGTIRTLLTAGSTVVSTKGSYCSGTSGAVVQSKYWDGCPASVSSWGATNSANNLSVAVDAQGNLYLYESNNSMLVRKVLAQGTGTASPGTLNALASTYSVANPWQSLGTLQTQSYWVHFPQATAQSVTLSNSTNANFSFGTPSCTWYSSVDNSMDCIVTATYTPTAAGPQSAQVTLAAAGGESITLNLAGTVAGSVLAIDNATSAGTPLSTTATLFSGYTPYAVATDGAGNVYAAISSGGSYYIVESLAASPSSMITLSTALTAQPTALAVDATGNVFYLLSGTSTIQELAVNTAGGTNAYTAATLTYYPANLGTANPVALGVDAAGNVLVADDQSGSSTVYKVSPTAIANLTQATCSLSLTAGSLLPSMCQSTISGLGAFGVVSSLAVGPSGSVYVADTTNGAVYKLTPGVSGGIYGYTKSTLASSVAYGLAADAAGDVYAVGNSGVTMYTVSGATAVSVAGAGSTPLGLAVDGTGNVYVADSGFSHVTEIERGAVTENFGSSYSTQFAATLTNAGNLASSTQTATVSTGYYATDFNLAGGTSNGCSFNGASLLAAMNPGQACTMTGQFPAVGNTQQTDYIIYGVTAPATSVAGDLTLTGLADQIGFTTSVSIGAASTNSPVYSATATEVSYPITVTSNSVATDDVTPASSGPTTSNYVYVSVDSGTPVQYYFTSVNGLSASFTLNLTGLTATTTTKHSFAVTFAQQGSFLASSGSQANIAISQQPTTMNNWVPGASSQQVSAPIGAGVLNASITTSVAGSMAYAYTIGGTVNSAAYPSCNTATANSNSTPIDASSYLPIGTYTLYAIFCPTDSTDYASATANVAYAVTQASTVAAIGASTNVVASDGTGNYSSLSAALAALPTTGGTIYIKPGTYTGQNAVSYPNVSLRGLGGDPTQVILTAEDGAFSSPFTGYLGTGTGAGNANASGDQGSSVLDVSKSVYMGQTAGSTSTPIGVTNSSSSTPTNFYAEYLTVQNTWDTDTTTSSTYNTSNGGTCGGPYAATPLATLYNNELECNSQALALWITGDQAILNNVNLISQQDTLYAGSQGCGTTCTPARQYIWKGTITGDVDYVFGDAALVFDHTNIFTAWHGTTATGTETIEAQNKKFQTGSANDYLSGYICNGCILMSQSTGMTNLDYGRPYGAYSTWIMLNSFVDQVNPAGWIEFSGDTNLPTSTYAEFNTMAYTDPAVGTAPYPATLFGGTVTPTGGNTGTGVTGVRETTSQDPGTPESANTLKTQLTAAQTAQYAPQAFLGGAVPTQFYPGFTANWNPQTVLAARVNAFVPPTAINPVLFGSSVTILGRPQTPGAGMIPTGTYAFYDSLNTNQVCTAASGACVSLAAGNLDASGEAYLTTSSLASGTHYITMVYGGDANFTASNSATYALTVLPSSVSTTTTALNVVNASSTVGMPIAGTVAVSPAAAGGTATIYLDGASATTCTLAGGTCSFSLSGPALGSHTLYASYSGGGSYGASTSATVTLNVAAAAATGDSRTVTEPSFPAVCQKLTAALTTDPAIQDLDASVDANNSNIDGARVQAAINACAGTGNAVELSMDATGAYNAFLTGSLSMPSNVTLLVDPGVTLYFSRNVQDYDTTPGTHTCGTIATTGSCKPLIEITKGSSNVGIMGYGKLNGRAYDVLQNAFATSGCSYPSTPTPSWWDLAGAYVSPCGQENPRFINMDGGNSQNITLYKITILNAPMFHVSTGGQVNGLTIWDVKISSPTFTHNTDGIDPGDTSNATIAYNWVSDGDDNVAVGAPHYQASNISVINNHFYAGHGESFGSYGTAGASNLLYDNNMLAGDAVSGQGSAINANTMTIAGTTYGPNYADGNSTAIRIKTANDRGNLITGVQYSNSCILDHKSDILLTPYYSSGDSTGPFPSYTNILLQNLTFLNNNPGSGTTYGTVELDGEYNTNNGSPVTNPLMVTLDNVTFPSALSSLVNSTTPAESSATSTAWGTNLSGGTGQYVNLTVGPGQVSTNFLTAYESLATVAANNDTLTNNISQTALNPPNCVFTYIAPELTGPTGLPQTIPYGSTANVDVILMPIVSGAAYPTGNFTVNDTTTAQTFTGTLTSTTDTHVLTIPASDLTLGTHTFTATYLGDSNYTIPASYQTFGSYSVTVIQATPTITWSPAGSIVYGTTLAGLLNATASTGGNFTYTATPAGGSASTVTGTTVLKAGTYTLTANFAPTDTTDYTTASSSVTLTVNQATPTVNWATPTAIVYGTALSATQLDATASVPGTFVYTPASGTVLTGGTQPLSVKFTPTDATDYTTANGSVNLAVNVATPIIALTTNSATMVAQDTFILTAKLTSAVSTPTGSVTFNVVSGPSLGNCTLSSGSCSINASLPTVGVYTVIATYSGDSNFGSVNSSPLTESIITVSIGTVGPGGGSTGSGSSSSQTVVPGGTAAWDMPIYPSTGTSFPIALTLTVAGLPANATATLTPSAWTQTSSTSWTLAAGTPIATDTVLKVSIPAETATSVPERGLHPGRTAPLALALLLLPFAWRMRRAGKRLGRLMTVLVLLASGLAVTSLSGCNGTGFFNQQQQTYTVTVTTTAGSLSKTTTLSLTVE